MMDIYTRIVDEFSRIPHVKEWEEVQALFRRVAAGKPRHWSAAFARLRSGGRGSGTGGPGGPVGGVSCHIGIVPGGRHAGRRPARRTPEGGRRRGGEHGVCASIGGGGGGCPLQPGTGGELAAMESVNRMFLATTIGQHWDVNSIVQDEDSYWKIARAKSSPFFGAAFQIGAWMGGASAETADRVAELGKLYGEMGPNPRRRERYACRPCPAGLGQRARAVDHSFCRQSGPSAAPPVRGTPSACQGQSAGPGRGAGDPHPLRGSELLHPSIIATS
ncbi:MAG: hypothetical protein HND47_03790 [Chloroflexi bacterium]|nr:hypothetical protein [Chloroflexota bacterium]